jgi:hypothetical protein
MSRVLSAIAGVAAETTPITPTTNADRARSRSAVRLRSVTRAGYNVVVTTEPVRIPIPRWLIAVLGGVVVLLIPWILYLTFTLPARHVTVHYDLAWVGFDLGLTAALAATTWAVLRGSRWLVPFAAVSATMLCCDAWFDVTTSRPGRELFEAIAQAALAELPLAALCAFIVYDAERFLAATITRFRRAARAGRSTRTG